jgi:hypothetical protein
MRKLSLHHFCLLLLSVIGAVLISGCSTANTPYRTYYQGTTGTYYYDSFGNKVYEGNYGAGRYCSKGCFSHVGHHMYQQDGSGRYYYEDSFGNKYYKPRACR